ncbi:LytR family transcriptional regulator [Bacillus sp. FJAT-42376]|uniref:LCP family protein n=1 Tax=Bacillus sp. FJAT-42376 TaxID=2014076 RepID=UPI000F507F9B|nr:LCP family protein [Bacillus sp. FJAT-42376]AZB41425.1 LytR family transcriptional regulator [Bacillus sp. FJAT-42376]
MIETSRLDRGKKKKSSRKTRKVFLLIFLLLLASTVLFFYIQYKTALDQSMKATDVHKQEVDFNGVMTKGKVNVLLLGIDSRGEEKSRTDTIMIGQYDHDAKTAKLVSIMRDSYVDIPGHEKMKINSAYSIGGAELLRKTIKENFDVDVQYYALVDFKGFSQIIDTAFPDGLEVNVEKRMSKDIGMILEPGLQRLDGKQTLAYVRFRKDAQSDFGRIKRQQEIIGKVTSELLTLNGVVKAPQLLGTIQPYINTNIDSGEVLSLATSYLTNRDEGIETLRIPADGTYEPKTFQRAGAVLDLDLEKNQTALKEFLGETE